MESSVPSIYRLCFKWHYSGCHSTREHGAYVTHCLQWSSVPLHWSYSPCSLSPVCIAASHSSFSGAGLCFSYWISQVSCWPIPPACPGAYWLVPSVWCHLLIWVYNVASSRWLTKIRRSQDRPCDVLLLTSLQEEHIPSTTNLWAQPSNPGCLFVQN